MSELIRFGVSMDRRLLSSFDQFIARHGFHNRSEALRDLVREKLSREEGVHTDQVMGSITIIYNHHIPHVSETLTQIQHEYQNHIHFTNHVHITREYCLEVIVVHGPEKLLRELANRIGGQRGVYMALPSLFTFDVDEEGGHTHRHAGQGYSHGNHGHSHDNDLYREEDYFREYDHSQGEHHEE
jgi:CopG family nickel-responsive transcriptional regulator